MEVLGEIDMIVTIRLVYEVIKLTIQSSPLFALGAPGAIFISYLI